MDSSGSLNAQVFLLLAERLRAKAVFQVTHSSCLHPPRHLFLLHGYPALGDPGGGGAEAILNIKREKGILFLTLPTQTQQAKFLTWQFDGEYRGDDYTATLTLGNPDLIGESGGELGQSSCLSICKKKKEKKSLVFHVQCSLGIRKGRFWLGWE